MMRRRHILQRPTNVKDDDARFVFIHNSTHCTLFPWGSSMAFLCSVFKSHEGSCFLCHLMSRWQPGPSRGLAFKVDKRHARQNGSRLVCNELKRIERMSIAIVLAQ
ncbi:unnamed protein product [Amoebophrya sp. A25]|nr:unnamed protein product [Amoebophrya sp. A25]|eukprot:GSA25T00015846001.1